MKMFPASAMIVNLFCTLQVTKAFTMPPLPRTSSSGMSSLSPSKPSEATSSPTMISIGDAVDVTFERRRILSNLSMNMTPPKGVDRGGYYDNDGNDYGYGYGDDADNRPRLQGQSREFGRRREDGQRTTNTRVMGQSPEERELRQMRYEDDLSYDYEEDYQDDYEDDCDYDDYENENNNETEDDRDSSGNFWSNPLGTMDTRSPQRRAAIRDEDERRRTVRPVPSSARRKKGSDRRTFRSGTPPPPNIVKDFYDNLFWYGFDPKETTTSADRTMFGGTKGKFNGLGLLRETGNDDRRAWGGDDYDRKRRDAQYYDDGYDDDDDDDYEFDDEFYEDDHDDQDYDNGQSYGRQSFAPAPIDRSRKVRDDNDDLGRRSQQSSRRNDSGRNQGGRDDFGNDNVNGNLNDDGYAIYEPEIVSAGKRRAAPSPGRRAATPSKSRPSSRSSRSRSRERKSITSSWFDKDGEDEERNRNRDRGNRRNRGNGRNERNEEEEQTSPLINILDNIFQVDPEEVKYQAEDYNRKLGLDKKKRAARSPSGSVAWEEERRLSRPRKGYAYRYVQDDDKEDEGIKENDYGNDVDYAIESDLGSSNKARSNSDSRGNKDNDGSDVIDVEASVQADSAKKVKAAEEERKPRQQSWEDRSSAYERVPPKDIQAWGPDGLIDGGICARTFAAQTAMEEIVKAKGMFEKKEKLVTEAEQDLLQLKKEAGVQKKRLLMEDDRRRSSMIRDRLRMINFDIEDSARRLRRAKGEALAAIDKLESIELRHWALLRQHEADQELEKSKSGSESAPEDSSIGTMDDASTKENGDDNNESTANEKSDK